PHHAVGEQHAWRAADGTAGLSAHRPLLCRVARKSGAVGRRAALVPHLERGTAKISARPAIDPARTPAAGLTPPATVANRGANCRRAWGQLPDLGSSSLPGSLGRYVRDFRGFPASKPWSRGSSFPSPREWLRKLRRRP